ncbi:hypothetical protein HZH68_011858 [Vespula germanica]|uniref:Uncharacterized protein n=1 Tax=Vespula germanica TaxID=30212 RepID=A0A834JR26_VESGE|nr:hypothetical protein HZH68_011858 [Vespula germanica]
MRYYVVNLPRAVLLETLSKGQRKRWRDRDIEIGLEGLGLARKWNSADAEISAQTHAQDHTYIDISQTLARARISNRAYHGVQAIPINQYCRVEMVIQFDLGKLRNFVWKPFYYSSTLTPTSTPTSTPTPISLLPSLPSTTSFKEPPSLKLSVSSITN